LEVVSYGNYDYVISVGFHVPTFYVWRGEVKEQPCNMVTSLPVAVAGDTHVMSNMPVLN